MDLRGAGQLMVTPSSGLIKQHHPASMLQPLTPRPSQEAWGQCCSRGLDNTLWFGREKISFLQTNKERSKKQVLIPVKTMPSMTSHTGRPIRAQTAMLQSEVVRSTPARPPSSLGSAYLPTGFRLLLGPHAWFAAFSWEKVTAWPIKESYEESLDAVVESTLTTSWTPSIPRKYHHSGGGS